MNQDLAMGNLGYGRYDQDFYATEAWLTHNLIPILKSENLLTDYSKVWECACGDGGISDVLEQHHIPVVCTDLIYRGRGVGDVDFLKTTEMPDGSNFILTNPPYGELAEEFVRHAINLTNKNHGTVGMLLRNEWDCGKSRMDLFDSNAAFTMKVVATTRPRWIANSTGSPRHNYSWFFWNHNNPRDGEPVIRYMNKDQTKNR